MRWFVFNNSAFKKAAVVAKEMGVPYTTEGTNMLVRQQDVDRFKSALRERGIKFTTKNGAYAKASV